jgi:hypothetical protein
MIIKSYYKWYKRMLNQLKICKCHYKLLLFQTILKKSYSNKVTINHTQKIV